MFLFFALINFTKTDNFSYKYWLDKMSIPLKANFELFNINDIFIFFWSFKGFQN